ncbi:MAG: hypothetical protein JW881_00235 [Spirochaetales bacterium]|nr:hypothetical protein [Spirochaetales bacterium]
MDACPAGAFTGKAFYEGEPREARYDVKKCGEYFDSLRKDGEEGVCGMCLYICPYGKKSDK